MKTITLLLLLIVSFASFSQKQEKQKETVYLLFDEQSKEKCKVAIEGKGYLNMNKFRKEYEDYGNTIIFKICNQKFTTRNSLKDTCTAKALHNIKLVGIEYLKNKHNSSNDFKHHVFEKIYFIEKLPNNKIIKYAVGWNDEITMIDD